MIVLNAGAYHLGLFPYTMDCPLSDFRILFLIVWTYPSSVCYLVFHKKNQRNNWLIPSSFPFTESPHVTNSFQSHIYLLPSISTFRLESLIPNFPSSPILHREIPSVPGLHPLLFLIPTPHHPSQGSLRAETSRQTIGFPCMTIL